MSCKKGAAAVGRRVGVRACVYAHCARSSRRVHERGFVMEFSIGSSAPYICEGIEKRRRRGEAGRRAQLTRAMVYLYLLFLFVVPFFNAATAPEIEKQRVRERGGPYNGGTFRLEHAYTLRF